jgi:hypothetical protein
MISEKKRPHHAIFAQGAIVAETASPLASDDSLSVGRSIIARQVCARHCMAMIKARSSACTEIKRAVSTEHLAVTWLHALAVKQRDRLTMHQPPTRSA